MSSPSRFSRALRRLLPLWGVLVLSLGSLWGCAEELEAFPDHYVGIGVQLEMETAGARVVRVLDGGPAAKAHFKANDVILQVDGTSLRGKSLADTVKLLRGAPNSEAILLIKSASGKEVERLLVRQPIQR